MKKIILIVPLLLMPIGLVVLGNLLSPGLFTKREAEKKAESHQVLQALGTLGNNQTIENETYYCHRGNRRGVILLDAISGRGCHFEIRFRTQDSIDQVATKFEQAGWLLLGEELFEHTRFQQKLFRDSKNKHCAWVHSDAPTLTSNLLTNDTVVSILSDQYCTDQNFRNKLLR